MPKKTDKLNKSGPTVLRDRAIEGALSMAGILFMETDRAGAIVYVNKALEQTLGRNASDLVGRFPQEFTKHGNEALLFDHTLRKLQETPSAQELQCHWSNSLEIELFVSWTATASTIENDTDFRAIFIGRILTLPNSTTEVLKNEPLALNLIFDQIPAVIWAVDVNMQITVSSGSALKRIGLENDQLLGSSLYSYVGTDSPEHPTIKEHLSALAGETVNTLAVVEGRHLQGVLQPIRSASGDIIGVIGLAIDVTERIEAAEALRQHQEELDTIINAAPSHIWYKDRENRILRINASAARSLGKTVDEVQGRSTYELYPDFAEKYHIDDLEVITTGIPKLGIVEKFVLPSGEVGWMRTDKIPYHNKRREIIGVIVFAVDITEAKRAEAILKKAAENEKVARVETERLNRIKDEFLVTLSHELRTPLTPILGWTELLQIGLLDKAASENALKAIERNAKAELQLIEDLLDTSHIISGTMRLDVKNLALNDIITSAVDTVRLAAHSKGLILNFVSSDPDLRVSGDAKRLRQIFCNLLENAVKFTPSGSISVRSHLGDSGAAEVSIQDSGIGIDADFMPHLFERFTQASTSTNRTYGGLGLGLSLVYDMVAAHGGNIECQSQGLGRGSTFIVTLPAPNQALSPSEKPNNPPVKVESLSTVTSTHSSLVKLNILVVDDSHEAQELVESVLQQLEVNVRFANSTDEALNKLKNWTPDLIISDIGMKGRDGYELIRAIRNEVDSRARDVPAIALTAFASVDDKKRALEAGFQCHLAKPVSSRTLIQAIVDLSPH